MITQVSIAPGNRGRTWVHMQVYDSQGCNCDVVVPLWLTDLVLESI